MLMTDELAFIRLFDYLLEEGETSSTSELLPLSDLDQAQFDQFTPLWNALETPKRTAILSIMGQLTNERIELSFDKIYQLALQDPDAEIRRIAIENLWESEDTRLIAIFLDMVQFDPSPAVRVSAARALGRFILLGQFSKISPENLSTIEDALLALVAESATGLQSACIEALGYSSRPGVDAIIEAAYLSEVEGIRQSSLLAMGRSANERWGETIRKELINPSPDLRSEAAKATGELELRSAVGDLIELLDDVNDDVRRNAIWSLGQIGGTVAREALEAIQASGLETTLEDQIQEALEHIAFLEGTPDFVLYDFNDDEDELA
jgi:HEAT repeat protein